METQPEFAESFVTSQNIDAARTKGNTHSLVRLLEARAAVLLSKKNSEAVLEPIAEAKAIARKAGLRPDLCRIALIEGQALLRLKRRAEACIVLGDAAQEAREMGLRPLLSQLLYWESHAREATGDTAGAADCLFEAAGLIRALGFAIEDNDMRESFLNVPLHVSALEHVDRLERAGMRPRAPEKMRAREPSEIAATAFDEVTCQLGADAPLRDVLTAVLDRAIQSTRADRGLLILMDDEAAEVTIARDLEGETIDETADYCRSVLEDVASGDPILAVDASSDDRFSRRKSVILYQILSLMCVPLKIGDRVMGALYFDSRAGNRLFREDDLSLAQAFSTRFAEAISEARETQRLLECAVVVNRRLAQRYHIDNLIGESPPMQRLFKMMEAVIRADCNVLVTGESGTGKELVARAIHFAGSRKLRNFIPLDCGALPENLVESELFGHKKGAFTGAETDKKGMFEEADGGTLFLDEIANTSTVFQAKLLRALQSGEFRRLGETVTRRADLRIIAATNADIDEAMRDGRFREDLYYRLNVVTLDLPPLRDRGDDVPLLAEHFARRLCKTRGLRFRGLERAALARLRAYPWPGNVRELEHAIEAALVVSRDGMVRREDLPEKVRGGEVDTVKDLLQKQEAVAAINEAPPPSDERKLIEDALTRTAGDKTHAARLLGWNRMRLYRRMKSLGISYDTGKH